MMKISILTLFPEQFKGFISTSIIKKAILSQKVSVECIDIRAFSQEKHNRVDDKPYGGGAGLVMRAQPIVDAIRSVKTPESLTVLLAPSGHLFKQDDAKKLAQVQHLILVCGHYEGVDYRIMKEIDLVYCIGDYILTGGELAAMVISDTVIRLVEHVISKESIVEESFENNLLEYPHYTTPMVFEGESVPEVLASGHHEKIRQYRLKKSLELTLHYRPDLLKKHIFSEEETKLLNEIAVESTDEV